MARRSRGTQLGTGTFGSIMADRLNLLREHTDTTGFLRIENRPDERPFAYMPALPAIGIDAHINLWQFNNAYHVNATNIWTQYNSGSGTGLTVQDARGGIARVTNGATDNNYYNYFSKYEVVKLQAGKGLWLDMMLTIDDVDEADWFFGLSTIVADAAMFDARVDAIGFYGADGSANINCECRKNSTATASTAKGTLTDETIKKLSIYVNGASAAYFYIGNSANRLEYVGMITTNLPDDEEMAIAFGIRNGQGVANWLETGRIILIQDR